MNIGLCIPSAAPAEAPTGSSPLVDQGQVAQLAQRGTFSALFKDIAQSLPDASSTSDIEALVPPADSLAASTSANLLVDMSQFIRLAQGEMTSTLSKALAQSLLEEENPEHSEPDAPADSIPSSDGGTQSTLASMMGFAPATDDTGQDVQELIVAETVRAEVAQIAQPSSGQGVEVLAVASQSMREAQTYQSEAKEQDRAAIDATLAAPTDLHDHQVLQPLADPGRSDEALTKGPKQTAVGTTNESPVRDGRGSPVDPTPGPLEQPSGDSTLFSLPLPGSLDSDRWPSSVKEQQGTRNFLASAYTNGGVQTQGTEETAPRISLAVPAVGASGGVEQDPFGTNTERAGDGAFSHSGDSQFQESLTRDNQSLFFSGQFGSARQAQATLQGAGASGATPAEDHLKMAQVFLGEDHSATMTSAFGKAQTVHVELPLHDSGPLSVRISMTDQTVHTQFTTDRNDLGALLLTRQDQLQQTLVKSGLELGQFQVHIDQRGQQDAAPDRQARRNADTSEHPPGTQNQNQNQDAQDQERHNYRPQRALSLFA
jgi:Flagellar hook-length control protein FliK